MYIFLYTDIEGSTQLWENHGETMGAVLDRHDEILRKCIKGCGGEQVKHTGDGIFAFFEGGNTEPLECALAMQRQLAAEKWPDIQQLRIRIALHAGDAQPRAGDYFGPAVNRIARLLATAWGGQIVLTPEVASEVRIPEGAILEDLGVHLLKDLSEPQQVFGLLHSDLPLQEFPALRSMSSQPNNLPRQPTPLVGREKELDEISRLLARPDCRLLTLVAPGGMGKTRLGLQAAADQIDNFRQGVFFVPLAGVTSPEQVPSSIASALGFSFYGSEDLEIQLQHYLREKKLLLLMDNFEHLIAGADIAAELLATAPDLKILVTSRRQLQLQAEWIYEVSGLPTPEISNGADPSEFGAVELFLQSARRIQAGFEPKEQELQAVVDICRLVDGMPLALVLAAAWLNTLSSTEIAEEIKQDIDILATEMRDVPPRQRSVRAVFEHSWNDLRNNEKGAFEKLSVFRGGFTRAAAQDVCGAGLRIVSKLISKSLVTRDDSGRFHVHELLRQFAAEKLAQTGKEAKETQNRHAAYYSHLLKELEGPLIRGERSAPVEEIGREFDNVLLAWSWALEHRNLSLLEESMRSLFWFYEAKSWYSEGEDLFRSAAESLSLEDGSQELDKRKLGFVRANMRLRQAWYAARQSHYRDARSIFPEEAGNEIEESDLEGRWVIAGLVTNILYGMSDFTGALRNLEEYDAIYEGKYAYSSTWPWSKAQTMANQGRAYGALGNYEKAKQLLQNALVILRPLGDHISVMLYLHTLGGVVRILGDVDYARRLFQESLELSEEHQYVMGRVLSLGDLGDLDYEAGQFQSARERYEISLTLSEEIGDRRGRALALTNLGRIATDLGEYDESRRLFERGLDIAEEAGNRRGLALTMIRLSKVHRLSGDLDRALELTQDSESICNNLGYRKGSILASIARSEISLIRGEYQRARKDFQFGLTESEALGFTMGMVLNLIGLGSAERGLKELEKSEAYLRRAITISSESRLPRVMLSAVVELGNCLADSGKNEEAVEMLTLAVSHAAVDRYTWDKAAGLLEEIRGKMNTAEYESAVQRGRALSLGELS